ncbi:MAG: phosphoglucomutase/phosphomannomutase family protein, partial [Thermoprotei archaeon]
MFTSKIRFGTDGWRSRMDADFNVENVRRLSWAVGSYLKDKGLQGSVLVGYDTRRNSSVFAGSAADLLSGLGFEVFMTSRPTPTPVVAFSVVDRGALAAVQITASHNPPIYNGFKFIPSYGGPAFPEITVEIEKRLPDHGINGISGSATPFDPRERYFEFVESKVDLSLAGGMRLVVDPLYGAGFGYLAELLKRRGASVTEIHGSPDPEFGGLSPEPNEANTRQLAQFVVKSGADMGVANDGDADRFAAVDDRGNFYPSNKLVLIIAEYLLGVKNIRGRVARSVSTTSALDRLCSAYGVEVVETPVGFKYIAKELMSGAVLGAEESGGLGFGWSVPEKDGIMSGALLCEAIGRMGGSLREAWERVAAKYGFNHYLQFNLPLKEEARSKIEALRANPPDIFAGMKVTRKVTIDGLKLH